MKLLACIGVFTVIFFPAALLADDWPQWLGPQRDGVWREKGLLEKFPPTGPKVLWRTEPGAIGEGYAGPAVAEGCVYIADRVRAKGAAGPTGGFDKATFPGVERIL